MRMRIKQRTIIIIIINKSSIVYYYYFFFTSLKTLNSIKIYYELPNCAYSNIDNNYYNLSRSRL